MEIKVNDTFVMSSDITTLDGVKIAFLYAFMDEPTPEVPMLLTEKFPNLFEIENEYVKVREDAKGTVNQFVAAANLAYYSGVVNMDTGEVLAGDADMISSHFKELLAS